MFLVLMALLAGVGWGLEALAHVPNGGMILLIILGFLAVELAAELVLIAWEIMPVHGILHLLGLPLRLLRLRRGQTSSLQQKNIRRATAGAFVLAVCAVLAVN